MATTFIRDTLHPPRAGQFTSAHPGNLHLHLLQPAINDIWFDLIDRFKSPIRVFEDKSGRHVAFLDTIFYDVSRNASRVSISCLQSVRSGGELKAMPGLFAIDPPLIPNGKWLEHYLNHLGSRIDQVLIEPQMPGPVWRSTVEKVFWKAISRSIYWKRVRYAMREALKLDPKILEWSRKGRSRHSNRCVTNNQYHRTVAHRTQYARIERDNPNLTWLYTFMLDEGITLGGGEAIASMKAYLQNRTVTPAGWRLLANGHEKDFRHIRDWIGPDGETAGRISKIPAWLRFMVALRRKAPFSSPIRQLFLHDSFNKSRDGYLRFRNVWLNVPVLRTILAQAEHRLSRGSLQSFIDEDLVEVMGWLETEQPVFDSNQIKAGWKYLTTQAERWKVEIEAAEAFGNLRWESLAPITKIGPWTVVPIEDAWTLRKEALRQHHCADIYLKQCLAGEYRIFSVKNDKDHHVATIGIELKREAWVPFDIRLSCNRPVTGTLVALDREVAKRYTDIWRLMKAAPVVPEEVDCEESDDSSDDCDEADGEPPACPVCGDRETSCNHVVACVDVTFGELVGGELYGRWDSIRERMERIIRDCMKQGQYAPERSKELDTVLLEAIRWVERGDDLDDVLSDAQSALLVAARDTLSGLKGVDVTWWSQEDNMPGQCSTYFTYWAADPKGAVDRLEAAFAPVPSADDVIEFHESRLGITVDRNDPMLPAMIAYERAMLKLMEMDDRKSP